MCQWLEFLWYGLCKAIEALIHPLAAWCLAGTAQTLDHLRCVETGKRQVKTARLLVPVARLALPEPGESTVMSTKRPT